MLNDVSNEPQVASCVTFLFLLILLIYIHFESRRDNNKAIKAQRGFQRPKRLDVQLSSKRKSKRVRNGRIEFETDVKSSSKRDVKSSSKRTPNRVRNGHPSRRPTLFEIQFLRWLLPWRGPQGLRLIGPPPRRRPRKKIILQKEEGGHPNP